MMGIEELTRLIAQAESLERECKRINLIEQTGRGIGKICLGQLRYGRPMPDYTRSDEQDARVVPRGGEPSLRFAAFA